MPMQPQQGLPLVRCGLPVAALPIDATWRRTNAGSVPEPEMLPGQYRRAQCLPGDTPGSLQDHRER